MPKKFGRGKSQRFEPYVRRSSNVGHKLDIAQAQRYLKKTGKVPRAMGRKGRGFWITQAAKEGAGDLVAYFCKEQTWSPDILAAVEGMVLGDQPQLMATLGPLIKKITDPAVRRRIQPWAQVARREGLKELTQAFEDNGYPTTPSSKPIKFPLQKLKS